jgi:hypothetical protein
MSEGHPKLEIEGLNEALEPFEYREDWVEGALTISARVRVKTSLGEALRKLWRESSPENRYFYVVRVGRDEERREMRFGKPFWSQHDSYEKHEVILVDRACDQGKKGSRWPGGPDSFKETASVIRTAEQMNALLRLLYERGRLSQQDIDQVRNVSKEQVFDGLLEFERVDDLDDWE